MVRLNCVLIVILALLALGATALWLSPTCEGQPLGPTIGNAFKIAGC